MSKMQQYAGRVVFPDDETEMFELDPDGCYVTLISAMDVELELQKTVKFWKDAHDNQVKLRRILMDRPDLQDRSRSITKLLDELSEANKTIEQLKRGEFICSKCGLRKDGEQTEGDF